MKISRILSPSLVIILFSITFGCQKKNLIKSKISPKSPKTIVLKSMPHTILLLADDKSEAKLGKFPWPRSYLVSILKKLSQAKAIVIAFSLDTKTRSRDDRFLENIIAAQKNVILQARLTAQKQDDGHKNLYLRDLPYLSQAFIKNNGRYALVPYTAVADRSRAIAFSHMNFLSRQNKFPLAVKYGDQVYPTIPMAVLIVIHGISHKNIYVSNSELVLDQSAIPAKNLNACKNTFMRSKPNIISFIDVLQNDKPLPVAGKVVIIGHAFKRSMQIQTQYGKEFPVVILAQRIESLLTLVSKK